MSVQPITFDYITAQVSPLDDRFHALIAKEQAGTITPSETAELNHLCQVKEAVGVPVIPVEHLRAIFGDPA